MIQSVWRLVSAHRPLIETANPAHMQRLAEAVKVILNKWSPEADRELDRRVENARDWLVYLLSLTSRDITCRQRPAADAPSILSAFSQVASVLRLLVGKYMGPRIEPGMRVYLATRLSEEARNLTYGRYSYRILYSAAGMDAEGHWMCDSLIGERSAIHQCFESGQPKPDDESNENAPVSDELAVHLRPVKVGNVVVCAIAISSNRQDPSHRLPDLCSEFEYILEWFLSIVATRIRQGTLKIAADSPAIGPKSTDDDIGLLVENQLQKINELNSFKKTREPREELKIKSSETPQA
jgi:hypothetical protein